MDRSNHDTAEVEPLQKSRNRPRMSFASTLTMGLLTINLAGVALVALDSSSGLQTNILRKAAVACGGLGLLLALQLTLARLIRRQWLYCTCLWSALIAGLAIAILIR